MEPLTLVREVELLPADLRTLVPQLSEQVRATAEHLDPVQGRALHLVGCGDSYHAAIAAREFCRGAAGLPVHPHSARTFTRYETAHLASGERVVGASASGRTPPTIDALVEAAAAGASTWALSGDADSPLARQARHSVTWQLPDKEPAPGIRTFQATLVAMATVAGDGATDALDGLADAVEATVGLVRGRVAQVAGLLADTPGVQVAGVGPHLGTALHYAAKLTEAAGIDATAHDAEEWWHVGRRARWATLPVVVVTPPGRAREHALVVAHAAGRLGRPVVVVAPADDTEAAAQADAALPVAAGVPEELWPFVSHAGAGLLAAAVAEQLGRRAFDGDPPGFPGALEGLRREDERP